MKHKRKRVMKIIDEITNFLFFIGSKKISIDYEENDEGFLITLEGNYKKDKIQEIYNLVKYLNYEKEEEMEEYYWELSGKYDMGTELTLVGMMTDDAKVYYDNEKVTIFLIRYK